MRLHSILLLTVLLHTGIAAFSQKISIHEKNIPLSKVFSLIQQQAGFSFLYDNYLLKQAKNINIDVKDASIREVLDECLKNLPLTYVVSEKIIVIKEKPAPAVVVAPVLQIMEGTVRDENDALLANASVYIKELKVATQTNSAGFFSIEKIPPGTYMVTFSFIGFAPEQKQVKVGDATATVSVKLAHADNNLQEISVVTALGITRKSRTLTYSAQSVSGEELSTVKSTNVLNSLNGRVSGIQVNRTSGGAGGSVRIVLRGDKSTRNSQPLYVIDGLPIINPIGGPNAGLYNGSPDEGDIPSTLNPDDIESINVLKGASASALYGSQGSNGVILINTKRGKSGQTSLNYSSSLTFDKSFLLPDLQYDYAQSTPPDATSPGSEDSWGAKGATQPGKNYVKNFFQTGITFINSINLSSGKEHSSNYLSYSNTDNKGVIPGSTYKENTLGFRQSSKLLDDRLTFEGAFLGTIQDIHNRPAPGVYYNPLTGLYMLPRGLDFNAYNKYEYFSPSRYLNAQNWWNINYDKDLVSGGWGGQDYQQNPYWVINRNLIDNRNQNVYASVSLKYLLSNWLTLQARGNINSFINQYERRIYATTQSTLARFNGGFISNRNENTTLYGDVLISGERKLHRELGFNFTAGLSIQDQKGKSMFISGTPTVPNVFLESALERSTLTITNDAVSRQIQSVFGTVQFSYRNKFFLDITDRNDWSSTLAFTPTEKKGYNYYSVGVNGILSEWLRLPQAVDFAKLRISYAAVGNDIAAFSTYPLYFFNTGIATPPTSRPINVPGFYLKPEKNKSLEIGTQWTFLQNRFSLDITWYKSNIINQYFKGITVPPSLGAGGTADVNGGNIQNTGIEIVATSKIIRKQLFSWTATLNFSHNKNRIVELFNSDIAVNSDPDQKYRLEGGSGGNIGVLKLNGSYGDMYGRAFKRDAAGHIVVNASTGIPYLSDEVYLGNPNPTYIIGLNNAFTLHNLTIRFLIDAKLGSKVLSITEAYLDQMGVSKRTGDVRDNGGTVNIPNAVDEAGRPVNASIDAKTYYKTIGGKTPVEGSYLYDGDAIRLREFSVSWRFALKTRSVKELRLGLVGNNVCFFLKKSPFDPEQVAGVNPGGTGVDVFGLPAYRSVGLILTAAF